MNDFMLAILGAAAEFERELISERVRDGLARAKRDGVKLGKRTSDKTKAQSRRVIELNKEGLSIREISQRTNLGRGTVYNILKGNLQTVNFKIS
jgi:DNA invertase Pin-like site-specific DNA recombinase